MSASLEEGLLRERALVSVLQDDRMLSVGALVSVWLGEGVPRWEAGLGECLTRDGVPKWEAGIGVCLARDGIPRWGTDIGECLARDGVPRLVG